MDTSDSAVTARDAERWAASRTHVRDEWGDGDPSTGVDREFTERQEQLRLKWEASKSPDERHAEAEELEAVCEADAAAVAECLSEIYGFPVPVQRPNGQWKTAEQRLQQAAQHRARADGLRLAEDLRRSAAAAAPVAPQRVAAARPREHAGRRSGTPPRGDPDRDPDPEPPARLCAGGCGRELVGRPHKRTCGAACRQRLARASRADRDWQTIEGRALVLVRRRELDPYDALALVVWPTDGVLTAARAA